MKFSICARAADSLAGLMRWYSVGPTSAASRPMITSTSSSSIRVKPNTDLRVFTLSLPVLEIRAVARLLLSAAAHVDDAGLSRLLVVGPDQDPRVALLGDRVRGDAAQVAPLDELVELGRIRAEVGVVIVDRLAQRVQVLLERGF